ncbi:Spy/CpxP family protein refolding chaperone [Desulfococcaceae bacterium HSG8]|nr:Spy/CpxP family protein refolding chaperone [Desulfococcaceae bacterium HSG8]
MKGTKTLSIVLVLVMIFAGTALAGGFGGFGHGGMGKGFRALMGLDLSDAQKTQVANIITKYRDNIRTSVNNLLDAKKHLNDVMLAEEFNEAAVREAFQQIAAAGEELAVLKAKIAVEVRPVLTPDQIAQFREQRAEMTEAVKEHMESKRSKFDAWLESHAE